MPEVQLKIQVRIEELPTIAGFLKDSFTRDLADFTDYSPAFDSTYLTGLTSKIAAVRGLLNPRQSIAEEKVITQRIATNMFSLQDIMSKLEGYVNRADTLTVAPEDFGIKEVRKAYSKGDQEALDGAISYLLANVDANIDALTAKGYNAAKRNALAKAQTAINTDNLAQNAKQSNRSSLVQANYRVFNELWTMLTDIADAGKRIYKTTAPEKVSDYTMAELKRRIRQEQKHTKLTGRVTANAVAVAGAKIAVVPAAGGRSKSTTSKDDGSYEMTDIVAAEQIVTATATGCAPKVENVTIASNEEARLNFELVS